MNEERITGKEILKRWDALRFELLNAVKNGLSPYIVDTGEQFVYRHHIEHEIETGKSPGDYPFDVINMFDRGLEKKNLPRDLVNPDIFYFLLKDVEDYEEQNLITPVYTVVKEKEQEQAAHVDVKPEKQKPLSIDVPEGTIWANIHIRIVNDDYMEISHPGAKSHKNIERKKIGLTQKPWEYFVKLARDRGEYIPKSDQEKKGAPSHFKKIRATIKELFPGIKGKPIADQNRRTGTYKAAFTIVFHENFLKGEEIQNAIGDNESRRKELEQLIREQ